jgi:hypothetical protein
MGLRQAIAVGILSATVTVACGDDGGPGGNITIVDLVGTWNATTVTYTSQADGSKRVDLIAGDGRATLTISSDGRYTFALAPALGAPEVSSGFAVIESGFLLLQNVTEPGVTVAFAMTVTNGTLGLVTDEVEYDFDGNDEGEPAFLQIGLRRASGTTVGDLAGTWVADEYRLIRQPARADTVDFVAAGGSLSVSLDAVGRYTASAAEPGEPPIVESGVALVEGDRLVLIGEGAAGELTEFTYQLSGDTLSLEGQRQYDFDDDGIEEDAIVEIVLART